MAVVEATIQLTTLPESAADDEESAIYIRAPTTEQFHLSSAQFLQSVFEVLHNCSFRARTNPCYTEICFNR